MVGSVGGCTIPYEPDLGSCAVLRIRIIPALIVRYPTIVRRMLGCGVVIGAVHVAGARTINFGGLYRGDRLPDDQHAPADVSIWQRRGSQIPIRPNFDDGHASTGFAAFDDDRPDGRIEMSRATEKRFGEDPRMAEYAFELRAKIYERNLRVTSVPASEQPLAAAAFGFRDEQGNASWGKTVMLGFFPDIDPKAPGLQRGIGLVDQGTRLVKVVADFDFADGKLHDYRVSKYIDGQRVLIRVEVDGVVMADGIDYAGLSSVTAPQNGFGLYTSTAGIINISVAELSYGTAVDGRLAARSSDPRDLANGDVIYDGGYVDQPYMVVNGDGSITCLLTISGSVEGGAAQRVVATRSSDDGATWSAPVALEPAGSPENSWAMPVRADNGRIYAFYSFNAANLRTILDYNGKPFGRVDCVGQLVFRYSDDMGVSWSHERYTIPIRSTAIDYGNIYKGDVDRNGVVDDKDSKFFWCVGKPVVRQGEVFIGLTKISNFDPDTIFRNSEGFLIKGSSLPGARDPAGVEWQLMPEGKFGLRTMEDGVMEEATPAVLPDGRLITVCRTVKGLIQSFYSEDGGRSWSAPSPLRYFANRVALRNPRAKVGLWRLDAQTYAVWFENNGYGGYDNRNPAWISLARVQDGELLCSQPEILLYSEAERARFSYPDLIVSNGRVRISEANKVAARIHTVPSDLLAAMARQFDPAAGGPVAGLLAAKSIRRSRQAELATDLDVGRNGFSIAEWVKPGPDAQPCPLFELRGEDGFRLTGQLVDNRIVVDIGHRSDVQRILGPELVLSPDRWHHVVAIMDPGPRILMFVVDGILCDGGSALPQGWLRIADEVILPGRQATTVAFGRIKGERLGLQLYGRAMWVSEAIGLSRMPVPITE